MISLASTLLYVSSWPASVLRGLMADGCVAEWIPLFLTTQLATMLQLIHLFLLILRNEPSEAFLIKSSDRSLLSLRLKEFKNPGGGLPPPSTSSSSFDPSILERIQMGTSFTPVQENVVEATDFNQNEEELAEAGEEFLALNDELTVSVDSSSDPEDQVPGAAPDLESIQTETSFVPFQETVAEETDCTKKEEELADAGAEILVLNDELSADSSSDPEDPVPETALDLESAQVGISVEPVQETDAEETDFNQNEEELAEVGEEFLVLNDELGEDPVPELAPENDKEKISAIPKPEYKIPVTIPPREQWEDCQHWLEDILPTPPGKFTATVVDRYPLVDEFHHLSMEIEDFQYVEGQSVRIHSQMYPIVSSRYGDDLEGDTLSVCVKDKELSLLQTGDVLEVEGPYGRQAFEDIANNVVFLGEASKFRGIARRLLAENTVAAHMFNGKVCILYTGQELYSDEWEVVQRWSDGRLQVERLSGERLLKRLNEGAVVYANLETEEVEMPSVDIDHWKQRGQWHLL